APLEWHAEQLRSLKIGPRPSCWVSVSPKFAFAAANWVAFVPAMASPSAKLSDVPTESSIRSLQPVAARGDARTAASASVALFMIYLLRCRDVEDERQFSSNTRKPDAPTV